MEQSHGKRERKKDLRLSHLIISVRARRCSLPITGPVSYSVYSPPTVGSRDSYNGMDRAEGNKRDLGTLS